MHNLHWIGRPPSEKLTRLLRDAGWAIGASEAAIHVVQTRERFPTRLPQGPWILLFAKRPPAALTARAVDAGALDAISTDQSGWEARLLRRLDESLVEESAPQAPPNFVAHSASAQTLLKKIAQAARTSMPVLLSGETGTGKELAARLIHQWSLRRDRTFVPINCAAIPNELMEGELFGYAKGAFSGAVRGYDGLVFAAEGGTVLLDEIDDTPLPLQQKLLRVLEDRVVSKLGENVWHTVDFRILAATNRDLGVLIAKGAFGEDLYERLATVHIELPPLRERLEDFEPLVLQLIARYYTLEDKRAHRFRVRSITSEALELLRAYAWPGNVRELRNVIFGALVAKRAGEELLAADLPRRLWHTSSVANSQGLVDSSALEQRMVSGTMNLREEIEKLERLALTLALRRARGNAAEAARLLGEVGRGAARDPGGTVRTMLKRLGMPHAR